MSITITDTLAGPSIEQIDAELDNFNDAMSALGYDATVRTGAWGEQVIEVFTDQAKPIEEFWEGTPGFLDAFRTYSNRTQDATSHARAELKAVNA